MRKSVSVDEISEAELKAIERRSSAATPGTWHVRHLDDDWATSSSP